MDLIFTIAVSLLLLLLLIGIVVEMWQETVGAWREQQRLRRRRERREDHWS